MVSTIDFNVSPYFDDFDPGKKFLRHLFRPGFAVQARELTQIQTILQDQVDRFGSHIFEDGSKVLGSDISDQNVRFLRINPQFDFGAGLTDLDLDNYIGKELVSALKDVNLSVGDVPDPGNILGDLKATVIHAIADTTEDPFIVLFLEYTSNGGLQLTDDSNYVNGEDFDDTTPETVTGQSSGATATVVAWSPVAPGNPGSRLYLKDVLGTFQDGEQVEGDTTNFEITIAVGGQLDRTEFQPGDEIVSRDQTPPNENVIRSKAFVKNVDNNLDQIQDDFIAVTGDAILASIDSGVFFVEGFFTQNDAQRVVPFRLSALDEPVAGAAANVRLFTNINARIGFDISKDIVTSEDDTSLLDPSFGSPNFNAPGADRFRIQLLINFKLFEFSADTPADYSAPDFVEWMRISQDVVVLQAVRPNYSALENELADRIEGIHGSFTVRAFSQDIRPHLKADLFILDLTSVLGTFVVGETITGSTSGATAQVDFVGDYTSVPTDQVEAIPLNGVAFLDNETITGGTSGATGIIDPAANPATASGIDFREDTSGVFTLAQGGEEDSIAFGLEPGRAFVQGFDFHTLATEFVKIDKARDTSEVRNFNIFVGFGNFVLVDSVNAGPPPAEKFVDWNANFTIGNQSPGLTPVDLFDSAGVTIGTSRVRQITQDVPGTYRIYLFDSVFNAGKTMADLDEIRDGVETLWKVKDPEGVDANVFNRLGEPATILFEGERNSLVFPVPVGNATEKFTETDWRSQQQFDVFLNASGIGNVSTTSPDIRFVGGVPALFFVSSANLIHYTVIDQSNGNIVDMSLPGNSIQTNNGAPASNGNVVLTVGDDGTGNPITSTTVTLIATLEINDDPIGDEPLIRRNKVLQKNVNFVGIELDGEVVFEGTPNLSDTLTQGETLTVTSPAPATATVATVDFTNDALTALLVFSFTDGGLLGGAFVEGETATALGGEIANINCNTLLVDAQLSNVTGSFLPGEVLFEGATPATAVALAVAITATRWEITFGMFTDGGVVEGASSGETANIAMDPGVGVARSTFTAAIFDYDGSTTTGVLSIGDTVTLTSTNEIEIIDVIEYRGKILTNVLGDIAQRTMSAGDSILGGTSSATAVIKSIRLIGTIPQSDIYGVVSILDQGNANAPVSTDAFFIDDGQRDNLYDFATAEYDNRNAIPAVGPFTFQINHFDHTGSGPFYVNSYTHPNSNLRFENIPLYTSPQTGLTVALRDSIDFRPIRVSADPSVALSEAFFPKNGEAFDADYSFFLPRIDKIILRREQKFDVIRGISSLEAQIPPDDPDALTLYVVKIPEFTYNSEDIEARYIENKRYTMSDIGDLDRRVERLEYYTSLSLLERETDALTVTDATGEDRFKNGILVDSFIGHSVGDVLNPDYDCAMDFEEQLLRPPFIDRPVELEELTNNGFVAISSDGIVTLAWQPEALVFQPLASTAISVNPFNVVNWMGALAIIPSSDTWIDVDQRPELRVNLEGENDAWAAVVNAANGAMSNGNGTQWGSWEQNWTGRTTNRRRFRRTTTRRLSAPHQSRAPDGVMRLKIEQTTATIERTTELLTGRETRRGIQTRVVPERIERSLGNRIVDVSLIQFIRGRGAATNTPPLVINADSMKPNTRVFPYFDDTLVSAFCRPSGGALGDPILTDSAGKIVGLEFELPAARFRTGDRLFRLTDEPNNIVANALTSAERTWNAQGLLQTREETIVSTRVPVFRRQSVTQSRPARDVRTRDRTVDAQTRVRWVDPLAQTFLVDSNIHPNGVFLTSLDLFFRAKDATIPVTIEIRPVVNGFPHSSAIVPFSEVTLEPAAVKTSEAPDPSDSNTVTTFAFTSPVHLSGGQEYAIVILSNSNEYLTYVAVIGQNQLGTEDRISMQPYAGSLFRSQNASTWTPDQTSDLMFVLNRAKFDTVNTGEIDFRNTLVANMATPVPSSFADEALVNEMYLLSSQLEFPDSELNLTVDVADDQSGVLTGTFNPILANQRERFADRRKILMTSDPETFVLKAQFISNDDAISPVLDQDRLTTIVIENRVNDSLITDLASANYNGELEPLAFVPKSSDTDLDNDGGLARYISRLVTLQPGFESTDLRVFLTVNKEIGADVQVFVKVQTPEAEGDFNDERFVQLFPVIDAISENEEDFREIAYELQADFAEPFSKFVVKIVMYSTDFGVTVPRVKDLRAIAVI